jgi:monofunctional biosynthetic peptidoglycan transglycosylase
MVRVDHSHHSSRFFSALRLGTDERFRGDRVAYTGEFTTEDGERVERVVDFTDLIPTHHGETLDAPPVDTANIEQIGILIGDKKPGPFQVQIAWITAD